MPGSGQARPARSPPRSGGCGPRARAPRANEILRAASAFFVAGLDLSLQRGPVTCPTAASPGPNRRGVADVAHVITWSGLVDISVT